MSTLITWYFFGCLENKFWITISRVIILSEGKFAKKVCQEKNCVTKKWFLFSSTSFEAQELQDFIFNVTKLNGRPFFNYTLKEELPHHINACVLFILLHLFKNKRFQKATKY